MTRWQPLSLAVAILMLAGFAANADPWKDESGKGRRGGDVQLYYGPQPYVPAPPAYG